MDSREKYKVIGMMSGTSLDGLDICFSVFEKKEGRWHYTIKQAETISYPKAWEKRLGGAHTLSGEALIELDATYGQWLGVQVAAFMQRHRVKPDFIASHGHTVFHQPQKGFTYQIGSGNNIYAVTGVPVVFDFRSLDVCRGGEGAPLVPVGDKYLFGDYDMCMNLGGIANVSMDVKRNRIAYDICFVNMGLNYLAQQAGKSFDKNGAISSTGEVDNRLMHALDRAYKPLRKKRPSLGREIFEKSFAPLLSDDGIPLEHRLRTFTESCAREISLAIREGKQGSKVLCTGGGAFNAFLISRLLDWCGDDATLVVADEEIIKFKEALVFGFLGVLRVRDEVNCLKSVTKASVDSSCGVLVGF